MVKNKTKSIKSVVNSNHHKNIANVQSIRRRVPTTNKCPLKNTAEISPTIKSEAIRQEIWAAEINKPVVYEEQTLKDITIIDNTVSDVFLTSLRCLTQEDIIPAQDSAHKKKKGDKLIVNLMLVVCAAVFVFSGYKLITKMISYSEAAESYDNIRYIFYEEEEDAVSEFVKLQKNLRNHNSVELLKKMEAPDEEAEQEFYDEYDAAEEVSELDKIRNKLQSCAAINPDTYGWINISELNIDYPVVKTSDNEYYLKHNFNRVYQEGGAIFADFHNVSVQNNRNTILYGHNMGDGSMFQNLLKYRYNKSLMERAVIELRTMDGIFVYKIFSVYKTAPTYNYIETDFRTDEEWLAFLLRINERSIHKTDITFTPEDKILTLSTCTNTWDNGRFAVHAILVEVRK